MPDILKIIWTLLNVLIILLLLGGFIQSLRWLHKLVELSTTNQKILQQILEELQRK